MIFRPTSAAILLLPGFDESWVYQIIDQLYGQGTRYCIVSMKRHAVRGERGLRIEPDQTIPASLGPVHLFIPKCNESLSTLMTDPRIHRLIQAVLTENGTVTVAPSIAAAFSRIGLSTGSSANYHVITSPERLVEQLSFS